MFTYITKIKKAYQNNGPPNIDEILEKWLKGFNDLLSGKPRRGPSARDSFNGTSDDDSVSPPLFTNKLLFIAALAILVIWFLLGFYIVDEKEKAVVLRFGKVTKLSGPGIYWAPPLVDRPHLVNVKQVRSTDYSTTLLTGDENIIKIGYEAQYIVSDAQKFLFNVKDREKVLGEVVNSTVREVIGRNKLDFVLLEGRSEVALIAKDLAKQILDNYDIGILLQTINIQEAQPPEEVQSAFDDANKAREDKERYINEAEAYHNEVVPVARGDAKQIVEAANAYKSRVVLQAEGDASRFKKVLAEYNRSPQVVERRMWIDTLEEVYKRNTKVYIASPKNGQLLYLPLDKLNKRIVSSSELENHSPPSTAPTSSSGIGGASNQFGETRVRDQR